MFNESNPVVCSYCGVKHAFDANNQSGRGHQAIKSGWQYKRVAKDQSILVICVNCKADSGKWTKYRNTEGSV